MNEPAVFPSRKKPARALSMPIFVGCNPLDVSKFGIGVRSCSHPIERRLGPAEDSYRRTRNPLHCHGISNIHVNLQFLPPTPAHNREKMRHGSKSQDYNRTRCNDYQPFSIMQRITLYVSLLTLAWAQPTTVLTPSMSTARGGATVRLNGRHPPLLCTPPF